MNMAMEEYRTGNKALPAYSHRDDSDTKTVKKGSTLPPLSFSTRREKTLTCLNHHQSDQQTMTKSSNQMNKNLNNNNNNNKNNNSSNNDGFPIHISRKSQSKRGSAISPTPNLGRYNSSERSSAPRDKLFHTKHFSSLSQVKSPTFSIENRLVVPTNMPEKIHWSRDKTRMVMKLKKSKTKKSRNVQQTETRYTQLHKLGLERSLTTGSQVALSDIYASRIARGNGTVRKVEKPHGTISARGDIASVIKNSEICESNKMETPRRCISPVYFQVNGLGSEEISDLSRIYVQNHVGRKRGGGHLKSHERPSLSETLDRALTTVCLGEDLSAIVVDNLKSKARNRELYPIFDWTEKTKENVMKSRFLDPILKDPEELQGRGSMGTSTNAVGHGTRIRDFRREPVPDLHGNDIMSDELKSEIIKRYHDSLSLSRPVMNPPPTAMEYRMNDLEAILALSRNGSPNYEESPGNEGIIEQTVNGFNDNDISEQRTHPPEISGIACKPTSTAITRSMNAKCSLHQPKHLLKGQQSKDVGQNSLIMENEEDGANDEKQANHLSDRSEKTQREENLDEDNHIAPVVPNGPLQIVIKVLDSQYDSVNESERTTWLGNASIPTPNAKRSPRAEVMRSGSAAFLFVPTVDFSLEKRRPGHIVPKIVVSEQPGAKDPPLPPRSTPVISVTADDGKVVREIIPSPTAQHLGHDIHRKNIVFISPAYQTKTPRD